MILKGRKKQKGMIFAGCSFTWGQGLYYYSGMDTLVPPKPHEFHESEVQHSHVEFAKSRRFPRLVANHFNSFEVCQPWNGGSFTSITNYWNNALSPTPVDPFHKTMDNHDYWNQGYEYDDFEYIVYQMTMWNRSNIKKEWAQEYFNKETVEYWTLFAKESRLRKLLREKGLTLGELIHDAKKDEIAKTKRFLKNFEEKGIKVVLLCWPDDLVTYVQNDPWMRKKLVTLTYKKHNYNSIESMMNARLPSNTGDANPELTIYKDTEYFEVPPVDHHPSLTCHQVIADNIIQHIGRRYSG